MFEMKTVAKFRDTTLHAHIRTYHSALLKMIMIPTASRTEQVK